MISLVGYFVSVLAGVTFICQILVLRRPGNASRDPVVLGGIALLTFACLLYEAGLLIKGEVGQLAIIGLMLLMLLHLILSSIRRGMLHHVPLSALIPAGISALLFTVNATMNSEVEIIQLLGRALGILSLTLLAMIFSLSRLSLRDVVAAVVLGVSLIFVISPFAGDSNWRPCDKFKCGPFGALYTGPFDSENTVAMVCGIAALSAILGVPGKARLAALPFFAVTLYATESRTSQLALIVGLVAWPLGTLAERWAAGASLSRQARLDRTRLLALLATIGLGTIFLIGIKLLVEASPSDFSNRGTVWIQGLSALGDSWTTGLGVDRWYTYQSVGAVPQHFPHSEYLFLLFTGGIGAILGLLVIYVTSFRRALHHDGSASFIAAYIVYLAVTGMTELFWNPIAADGNILVVIPILFIISRPANPRELETRMIGNRPLRKHGYKMPTS